MGRLGFGVVRDAPEIYVWSWKAMPQVQSSRELLSHWMDNDDCVQRDRGVRRDYKPE